MTDFKAVNECRDAARILLHYKMISGKQFATIGKKMNQKFFGIK